MPYYAGDYYRAGDRRSNYAAGSIWGFVKKAAGTVARTVIAATPAGHVINAIAPPATTMAGQPLAPVPGVMGAVQRMAPGGESGFSFRGAKTRRMNAGNVKAARRAIRRIKSVRSLLQSIERELPRRPAPRTGGSRGVITRSEAARALRS